MLRPGIDPPCGGSLTVALFKWSGRNGQHAQLSLRSKSRRRGGRLAGLASDPHRRLIAWAHVASDPLHPVRPARRCGAALHLEPSGCATGHARVAQWLRDRLPRRVARLRQRLVHRERRAQPGFNEAWTIVDALVPTSSPAATRTRGGRSPRKPTGIARTRAFHSDIPSPLVNSFLVYLDLDYDALAAHEWVHFATWGNNPDWAVHTMSVRDRKLEMAHLNWSYIGPTPQPEFPLRHWVRFTAYLNYQGAGGTSGSGRTACRARGDLHHRGRHQPAAARTGGGTRAARSRRACNTTTRSRSGR